MAVVDSTRGAGLLGSSAEEVLATLATQFRQRSAFVRELIQNSLDAGASHISLHLDAIDEYLHIRLDDDGCGMDRRIIEEHLLVLFRSTKDADHTQIGGFGVGFVSLFALDPVAVIVDTARYAKHLRVVMDAERHYTLVEVAEPFEGTSVELILELDPPAAATLAHEIYTAVHHWCRYAPAEITIEGEGPGFSFAHEVVDHPFRVDAPVWIEDESPGFRAVLGLTTLPEPLTAYYNRGLTLAETNEAIVPGVTFRVESGSLGHTLTRDRVRRDESFHRVVRRIQNLARGRLASQYLDALTQASSPTQLDHEILDQLLVLVTHPLVALPRKLACFRTSADTLVSLDTARPRSLLRLREHPIVAANRGDKLGARLTRAGIPTLLAAPAPDATYAGRLLGAAVVAAASRYIAPEVVPDHRFAQAVAAAYKKHEPTAKNTDCVAAHFDDFGEKISGRLAIRQHTPGSIEREEGLDFTRGVLVINLDHPTVVSLQASPGWLAGVLLLSAALHELGEAHELGEPLAQEMLVHSETQHSEGT